MKEFTKNCTYAYTSHYAGKNKALEIKAFGHRRGHAAAEKIMAFLQTQA